MRRIPALALLVVLLLIGLIGVGLSIPASLAQEATPEDEEFEVPEGISFEFIAFGELPAEMDPQAELSMYRILFESGAGFVATEDDQTTALVFVESGTLTFVVNAPIRV